MKILALYSIKGGVGKTASAVNLAYIAAGQGARTLLCDLDPQGSASFYFRVRPSKKLTGKRFFRGGRAVEKRIRGTDYENLDLLPSNLSFRNLDLALNRLKKSRKRLDRVLRPFEGGYEFILLDCPPGISLASESVFFAADHILVPCIPTTLSMLTYAKLRAFFDARNLNQNRLLPFFSMVEKRKRLHREVMADTAGRGGRFLKACIPYLSDVEKMGIHRQPVPCFRPESAAAKSYEHLWHEILQRIA